MPSALKLRTDYSAAELRGLAKRTRDNNQSRRLLSLAAVLDGMNQDGRRAHRGHGSPDPARLGASLQ